MVDAAMEELEVEVVARFLPDVVDGCSLVVRISAAE
jgi:hypothetical protein